jgi:hypothetical protein
VYNASELLLCGLPYHATPEFARLVALLQLAGTPWAWLGPAQHSGAPPPRDALVRRCVNDQVRVGARPAAARACTHPGEGLGADAHHTPGRPAR